MNKSVFTLLTLFLLSLLTFSCAQAPTKKVNPALKKLEPTERIFNTNMETIWKAAQRSIKYPLAVDNMETGILETEWVRSEDGFMPAHSEVQPSSGLKFKILVRVLRGKRQQKDAIRVTVAKHIERQKDFFADEEVIESDGWEEKVLLYRIDREIAIEEALKKGAFKGTGKSF